MQIHQPQHWLPGKVRGVLFCLILLTLGGQLFPVSAQSSEWLWYKQLSTSGDEFITSLAVDPSDNSVYAAGNWSQGGLFPPGAETHTQFISTNGDEDGFLVKYDSAGNYLWGFKLGGDSDDRATSVTLDDEGNVYITGFFGVGTAYFYGTDSPTGTAILSNSSREDFFLAKYNSSGVFQWVRRSSSDGGNVRGEDVSTNSSLVFAVGSFIRSADFGPLNTGQNPSEEDLFLVCYDKAGNEQWITTAGSNDVDIGLSVVADDQAVYFTGRFDGGSVDVMDRDDQFAAMLFNGNPGSSEIPLISFDAQGYYRWAKVIQGSGIDRGRGICMDSDSLYLTGAIFNDALFPGFIGNPVLTSSQRDIFLSSHAKVDGSTGWVKVFPSTNLGSERGKSLDINSDNDLIISGDFQDNLTFPGGTSISSAGSDDVFLASYSSDGEFLWGQQAGSSGDEDGNAIAAGSQGAIYAGGLYRNEMNAGPFTLTDHLNENGYLFKLQEAPPPPANDVPCAALLLETGSSCNPEVFSNLQATNSGIPDPGCGNYSGNDLWFKAVVPESGHLFIGTNTSGDNTFPPVNGWVWQVAMAIYTGSCDNLNLEGCFLSNSAYNFRAASAYLQNQNPGDTIWIRIWENGGDENGRFELCVFDPGHIHEWELPLTLCSNAGPIDLRSTLKGPVSGSVDQITGQNGVPDPVDALGVADDVVARLHDNGDWIKLDLTDTIPAGEVYWLHFRPNTGGQRAWANLSVSVDDVNYIPHSFQPETYMDPAVGHPIIAEQPTRYVLIENINSGGGGFRIDGIEYEFRATRGGSWSGPGVSGSVFDPEGLSGPVEIAYSLTSAGMNSSSFRTVTVLHSDAGMLTGDTVVCSDNKQVTLELQNSSGRILDWEYSTDGFSTIGSLGITENPLILRDLSGNTQYRALVQQGTCPADTSDILQVTIISSPLANPGPAMNACGLNGKLEAVPSLGTGSWSLLSGPGNATFSPSENESSVRVDVSEYGEYGFTWTEQNGVCFNDSTIILSFSSSSTSFAGEDQRICSGEEGLVLSRAGISDGEIIWTTSGNGWFDQNDAQQPFYHIGDDLGSIFLMKQVTGTGGCGTAVDTMELVILESPKSFAGPDGEICGLEYLLSATPSIGSGQWSLLRGPGKVGFFPTDTLEEVGVVVDMYGDYSFHWSENWQGCAGSDTVQISFMEVPHAYAGPDQILNLQFETYFAADVPSYGEGTWEVITGSGVIQDIHDPHSLVSALSLGENSFSWTIKTALCSSADSVSIRVEGQEAPTVITPNGDGLNDFLVLPIVKNNLECELIVFNRWGIQVYKNSLYRNDWDGRNQDGEELLEDTYYYILKIPSGRIQKGFVEIRR